jgi:dihydroneopterin aldolase
MEFHAFHGCLEHEKEIGNTFIISLEAKIDTTWAGDSDNLNDTLDYQLIYNVVKEEMEIPSNLIEHVSQRILNALMEYFPVIESLKIELSKLNPHLGGKIDRVTIIQQITRE